MIDLRYSLVIEATEEPDFFSFYSPDLEGFTGVGQSIEDCIYKARWECLTTFACWIKRAASAGSKSTPADRDRECPRGKDRLLNPPRILLNHPVAGTQKRLMNAGSLRAAGVAGRAQPHL